MAMTVVRQIRSHQTFNRESTRRKIPICHLGIGQYYCQIHLNCLIFNKNSLERIHIITSFLKEKDPLKNALFQCNGRLFNDYFLYTQESQRMSVCIAGTKHINSQKFAMTAEIIVDARVKIRRPPWGLIFATKPRIQDLFSTVLICIVQWHFLKLRRNLKLTQDIV